MTFLLQDVTTPQSWVIVGSFAALVFYLIRSEYNRWRDKKTERDATVSRELQRKAEKQERLEAEERASIEREKIASRIKGEQREIEEKVRKELERNAAIIKQQLELHYEREILELEKNSFGVIKELGRQEQIVKLIDGKIVTLTKAAEHKDELKDAIAESTIAAKDAFEVANTINLKLEKMSESGLLNQEQEAGRQGIDTIEEKKVEDKKAQEE